MKKIAIVSLLLAALLVFTACAPKTYTEADPSKYVELGEYKGITYEGVSSAVTDYELQVAINDTLKNSGYVTYYESEELKEGTVQLGDTVNINYKGLKDGVAFNGGTADNQSLIIGSGQFIPGFEEGLVGKAIGSQVSLNLTFPTDYSNTELAGQAVVFEVKINSVTSRAEYKELTDDLAHLLNSEVNTVEEFKNAIKEKLAVSKKAEAENTIKNTLWIKVIDNATVKELPEPLVKQAKEFYNRQFEAQGIKSGYDDIEEYVAASGLTDKQYQDLLYSYAEPYVEDRLIALAIAQAEGYTPTQEALDAAAKEYAAANGYSDVKKFIELATEDEIRNLHIMDYVIDLVLENAVLAQ